MQPPTGLEAQYRLAAERGGKHWGTASVDVDALSFPGTPDRENVDILTDLFRDDFQGLNPNYHIPAKIGRPELEAALWESGITYQGLREGPDPRTGYPEVRFPPGFRLQCLRGRSRAEAAKRALPRHARRWVVDLFQPGTPYPA